MSLRSSSGGGEINDEVLDVDVDGGGARVEEEEEGLGRAGWENAPRREKSDSTSSGREEEGRVVGGGVSSNVRSNGSGTGGVGEGFDAEGGRVEVSRSKSHAEEEE